MKTFYTSPSNGILDSSCCFWSFVIQNPISQVINAKNINIGTRNNAICNDPVLSEIAPIIGGLIASPKRCIIITQILNALALIEDGTELIISVLIGPI